METEATTKSLSLGETVLLEVQQARGEIATIRQFANLLGKRNGEDGNFLDVMTRLLSLLVAGTEETHRRLEALQATMTEPGIARAMRLAILED